jgi:hypothetical protein
MIRRTAAAKTAGAGLCLVGALASCGRPATEPREPRSAPETVTVTEADAGALVRLGVGERLVVDPPGDGAKRWVVARYPRRVLTLARGPGAAGRHVFRAAAAGRGEVMLLDLAGWPEGGPCDPRPESARRCLFPLQGSARNQGRFPERPRILGFEVVVV